MNNSEKKCRNDLKKWICNSELFYLCPTIALSALLSSMTIRHLFLWSVEFSKMKLFSKLAIRLIFSKRKFRWKNEANLLVVRERNVQKFGSLSGSSVAAYGAERTCWATLERRLLTQGEEEGKRGKRVVRRRGAVGAAVPPTSNPWKQFRKTLIYPV